MIKPLPFAVIIIVPLDRKEKNARKAKLSEYVNLDNGRFTDYEVEELESITSCPSAP